MQKQTIKFGHLIENMRKNFLEKSYTKCGGETIRKPFSKKSKLNISLNQEHKALQFALITYQDKGYQNIFKLSWRPLTLSHIKLFQKTKRPGTSLPSSFYS